MLVELIRRHKQKCLEEQYFFHKQSAKSNHYRWNIWGNKYFLIMHDGNIAGVCVLMILLQCQEDVKALCGVNFIWNLEIQVTHVAFFRKALICKCLSIALNRMLNDETEWGNLTKCQLLGSIWFQQLVKCEFKAPLFFIPKCVGM